MRDLFILLIREVIDLPNKIKGLFKTEKVTESLHIYKEINNQINDLNIIMIINNKEIMIENNLIEQRIILIDLIISKILINSIPLINSITNNSLKIIINNIEVKTNLSNNNLFKHKTNPNNHNNNNNNTNLITNSNNSNSINLILKIICKMECNFKIDMRRIKAVKMISFRM